MKMNEILRMLDALADPVRLRLLRLLRGRELCVCELVDALRMPQYAISRHLRSLRTLGLVAARRDGRWMHYRLGSEANDQGPAAELLAVLCRRLENESVLRRDDLSLRRRLAMGRTGRCLTGSRRRIRQENGDNRRRVENE
jgi:ArsR family transcriptional regulator